MKPRTPSEGLVAQFDALWEARLAPQGPPEEPDEMALWQAVIDTMPAEPDATFYRAGSLAVRLHRISEMPPHGARQSRATLERLAAEAIRKTP
jgi:hypothetical protein